MEESKKFLIAISPIFVIVFFIVWALVGLKDASIFMGALIFAMALGCGLASWVEFVYKHM